MQTLTRVYDIGALICFAAMMGCVLLEVVTRNIIHYPTTWAEELSRFMCVWAVFLGAASAWSRGTHIVINVLPRRLKGLPSIILTVLTRFLSTVFLFSVWIGSIFIMREQYQAKTTAMEISISWFYLALFIGTGGMIVFHLYQSIRMVIDRDIDKSREDLGEDSC